MEQISQGDKIAFVLYFRLREEIKDVYLRLREEIKAFLKDKVREAIESGCTDRLTLEGLLDVGSDDDVDDIIIGAFELSGYTWCKEKRVWVK